MGKEEGKATTRGLSIHTIHTERANKYINPMIYIQGLPSANSNFLDPLCEEESDIRVTQRVRELCPHIERLLFAEICTVRVRSASVFLFVLAEEVMLMWGNRDCGEGGGGEIWPGVS
jgi:hypothetical protein